MGKNELDCDCDAIHQKEVFLAKQKSPLYVAKNNLGDFLVASDPICFDGFSKEFYVFNDGGRYTYKQYIGCCFA